jgi:hypothetical protein
VVVVHGLDGEEAFAVKRLLGGLNVSFSSGGPSIDVEIPRSQAREAYLRIARSPYRDRGLLVEWEDE